MLIMNAATVFSTKIGVGIAALLTCILPFWAFRSTTWPFDVRIFPSELWLPLRVSVVGCSVMLAYVSLSISRFLIPVALMYICLAGLFISERLPRWEWRFLDLGAGWMLLLGGFLVLGEAIYSRVRATP